MALLSALESELTQNLAGILVTCKQDVVEVNHPDTSSPVSLLDSLRLRVVMSVVGPFSKAGRAPRKIFVVYVEVDVVVHKAVVFFGYGASGNNIANEGTI